MLLLVAAGIIRGPRMLAQPAAPSGPGARSVTGAVFFTPERIAAIIGNAPSDSVETLLTAAYSAQGFLGVRVVADGSGNVRITEGERYTAGAITFVADSLGAALPYDVELGDRLSGEAFSRDALAAEIDRVLATYSARGFPLATAQVTSLEVNDSARLVNAIVAVHAGERVRIQVIEVRGNTATRTGLILDAAAVKPGTFFTDELAAQVRARLVRLNLFGSVDEPQLYRVDSVRYGLLLVVTEGSPNTFDGVIGYQPAVAADSGSGTFTGLVNIVFRNIFGSGRRAALRWQKQTVSASQLEIRYGEPFILGLPLDLDVGFRQVQEATTTALLSYVQRFFTADLTYGLTDAFTVRAGAALESTIPQVDTAQPCYRQLLKSSTVETTVGIGYDTRSSTISPVSGVLYRTTYSVGARSVNGPAPCDSAVPASDVRQRIELDLETYVPAFGRFVAAGSVHYGEVRADLLEENDLFRFGGQATVRGYIEGAVRASRRTWGSLEARLLLSDKSYAAVFFDGGYYERVADTRRGAAAARAWLYGYGVGAQIETPLGLVRLSYALGRDDTFATGKVFVGLVNQF